MDNNGARRLFWFEESEGFRSEEGGLPAGVILDGPFRTEAEVKKHIRLTILGPQCKVIEGGGWDPNWAQWLRSLRTDLRISVSFGLCLVREVAADRVIEAWYRPFIA
jgi:hypothetical protein